MQPFTSKVHKTSQELRKGVEFGQEGKKNEIEPLAWLMYNQGLGFLDCMQD
jgi:hypothetical protein